MDLNLTQLIFELMKTGFLFFQSVAEMLTVFRSFAEVEEIARGSEEAVEGFRMPSPCVSKPVSSRLDCYAASLLQPEAQDRVHFVLLGMGTVSSALSVFCFLAHKTTTRNSGAELSWPWQ